MRFTTAYLCFFLLLWAGIAHGQGKATIYGTITDADGNPVDLANIAVMGMSGGAITDPLGNYTLSIPADTSVKISVTHINFETTSKFVKLAAGESKEMNLEVASKAYEFAEIPVEDTRTRLTTAVRMDPKLVSTIPNATGNVEALIKTLPGVSSNNELSSQYSVRGGNYDENLIYVNGIEVYRPQLTRSGQQEGLSFVNSDMVSSLLFSAGGFESRYGDKMSSVLDVQYRKPYEFGGTAELGLLGAKLQLEGSPGNHRFTYQTGFRYQSNQYVLQSLDTEGEYKPRFADVQAYLTYDISEAWEVATLVNIAQNVYHFIPGNRQTEFGTVQQALQLTVFFDGQEISSYNTYFGAIANNFELNKNNKMSFVVSGYRSFEDERFDVQGQYFIDELEKDLSKDNFGDVAFNRGVGTYLDHARNYLDINVVNAELKGQIDHDKHRINWGVKAQHEMIDDRLNEWNMIDSAGFSLPKTPDHPGDTLRTTSSDYPLEIFNVLKTDLSVRSSRFMGYVQDAIEWSGARHRHGLTYGVRANYWTYNQQTVVSPRVNYAFIPDWERDYLFRLSTGMYHQPPFYREMRNLEGELNPDIKAQRSYQIVGGVDYNFLAWKRPFKFTAEAYYKYMTDVIPYVYDNVRIRYYGENSAVAYATGMDFKINGEFVKGVESWFSMSLMKTEEDILNDSVVDENGNVSYPGYIPRPTDQRFKFSLFFQDYLPNNPTFKFNITLHYATGLPYGPPESEKYLHTLRMPPYRRVDLGLSKLLLSEKKSDTFKSIWLHVDVFNLFQISNTISYLWIKDIENNVYAVPNYLTNRQVNVKLRANF